MAASKDPFAALMPVWPANALGAADPATGQPAAGQTAVSVAIQFAARVAANGNTIKWKKADGTDGSAKALVDEQPSSLAAVAGHAKMEQARGRLALFEMIPADADAIPSGAIIRYDGESWTLQPVRSLLFGDVAAYVTFLGEAGAVP